MVIKRSRQACTMLLAPYNMDVPPFDHTYIDVEEWCHQLCIEGLSAYEYRRSQKDVKLEIEFEGEHFSTLPFHEFMVPEQGHDWYRYLERSASRSNMGRKTIQNTSQSNHICTQSEKRKENIRV